MLRGGENFEAARIIFEVDDLATVSELNGRHNSSTLSLWERVRVRVRRLGEKKILIFPCLFASFRPSPQPSPNGRGSPIRVPNENRQFRHDRNETCRLQTPASPSATLDDRRQNYRAVWSAALSTAATEKSIARESHAR